MRALLLTAFVVALVSSYIVYRLVSRQVKVNSKVMTTKVVFANRDFDIGAYIKPGDVKVAEILGDQPGDVVTKAENAVGRGVISPIFAGEPIHEKRLAKAGSGAGLAATIPDGMRACAVRVNEVVGVAGFASPGMRVDVLISGKSANTLVPGGTRVRTLLQNIEVLSAGKKYQKDVEGKPVEETVVNLLVTPEQAELLSLASSDETRIQLVLRNPGDRKITATSGYELSALLGGPVASTLPTPHVSSPARSSAPRSAAVAMSTPAAAPAKPLTHVVQVINGAKNVDQKFSLEEQNR